MIELLNTYTVVDIETTGLDSHFDEIIEIAAIQVSNGQEINRFNSLVKPNQEISTFISELTGITNEMVENSPGIDVVLPQFLSFIGTSVLVAHNANFDVNFIYDFTRLLDLPPLKNDFIDTLRLSRRIFPNWDNHKLQTLVNNLNISDTVEHRALSDCVNTHLCFESMKGYISANNLSLDTLWEHYGTMSKRIHAQTDQFDLDSPVYGRVFAFTGTLEKMPRKDAMQLVVNAGGICGDGVTQKTNFLVLGNNDYCKAIKGGKSSKQKKAEKLQIDGYDITTISENVFYDMIGAENLMGGD